MKQNRKIAVVTSSRADYWLLKPLMSLLNESNECTLQLIVMGSHLMPSHGMSVKFIEADGFEISAKIESILESNSNLGVAKSIGVTTMCIADALSLLRPDLLVVLGDRFEIFATAQSAYTMKIPVAHLHSGEVSYGALDDAYRHCIAKLSSIFFVSHEKYKKRLIQLGEKSESIYNFGACCLDRIHDSKRLPRNLLLKFLGLSNQDRFVLVGYHPSTLSTSDDLLIVDNLINELLRLTDFTLIITKANIDPMGILINEKYLEYSCKFPDRIKVFNTIGGDNYLNAVAESEFCIGNSSSGIIEVPYFKKPVINIGERQGGRERPKCILQCDGSSLEISNAIKKVTTREWVEENVSHSTMVYGEVGVVAKKIYDVLIELDLSDIIYKRFEDLKDE